MEIGRRVRKTREAIEVPPGRGSGVVAVGEGFGGF
jgi:hypothetical protein